MNRSETDGKKKGEKPGEKMDIGGGQKSEREREKEERGRAYRDQENRGEVQGWLSLAATYVRW